MDRGLIITADDFGLSPSYDQGMLEAVRAGAVDAVSVMVLRVGAVPDELREWGGAVGLHFETNGEGSSPGRGEVERQLAAFAELVGRPADYLDGHHHCHAEPALGGVVAELATELDLPVRSVGEEHRSLLRAAGVRTPDRLVGRYEESDPVVPAELDGLTPGWTEWMVHPGHADPRSGSSYDRGREEDLTALLALALPAGIRRSDQRRLPRR